MNASADPMLVKPVKSAASVGPPRPRSGRRRMFANFAKIAYAVSAATVSLFFAAHAPNEGAPIREYLPEDAVWLAQVRDGGALLDLLESAPGAEDLKERIWSLPLRRKKDASEKTLGDVRAEFQARLAGLPVSFQNELFRSVFGEWAVAGLAADDDGVGPRLLFVRLRGGAGALLRLALHVRSVREGDSDRWFDLGGGLVAWSTGGARPRFWSAFHRNTLAPPRRAPQPPPLPSVSDADAALVKIHLWPRPRTWTDVAGLTAPTTLALIPAAAAQGIEADDLSPEKGKDAAPIFLLRGVLGVAAAASPVASLPSVSAAAADVAAPIVVARTPFNAQAAFEAYLDAQLKQGGKNERRWRARMEQLREEGVDLSAALWAQTAPAFSLRISPPAAEAESNFPVLQCATAFLSQTTEQAATARAAANALVRVRWERFYERRPPAGAKNPCVRFFSFPHEDRYAILPGGFSCPLLTVGDDGAAFLSDVGFDGLRRAENEAAWPRDEPASAPTRRNASAAEPVFFLAYDGSRLASVAAAMVETHFEELRKDLSASEFEKKHPRPAVWATFASAAAAFSGRLRLTVDENSQIGGYWRIGSQAP